MSKICEMIGASWVSGVKGRVPLIWVTWWVAADKNSSYAGV